MNVAVIKGVRRLPDLVFTTNQPLRQTQPTYEEMMTARDEDDAEEMVEVEEQEQVEEWAVRSDRRQEASANVIVLSKEKTDEIFEDYRNRLSVASCRMVRMIQLQQQVSNTLETTRAQYNNWKQYYDDHVSRFGVSENVTPLSHNQLAMDYLAKLEVSIDAEKRLLNEMKSRRRYW